jgi:WD40 repeat protein
MLLLVAWFLALGTDRAALAISWDSDDFLIGGGPSFTTRIGAFDHDLTFKGFLDSNFPAVDGLDFDHAGHLVAVGVLSPSQQVRVYDSSGALIGGFTRGDGLLGNAGDLKVALDGSYVIGTGSGARRFLPDGTFIQQLGSGSLGSVAIVPGNKVWTGGIGVGVIKVFDLSTGMQVGTVALTGFVNVHSMFYSSVTNTVLVVSGTKVNEFDVQGNLVRIFDGQGNDTVSATRGPNGDVFATTGSAEQVLHWNANGDFLGSFAMPVDFGVNGIVWAGNAPEPTSGLITLAVASILLKRRDRSSR